MNHNISFIIPAYNCEKTLEESVMSIISTNLQKNDEIIIVDDASTDETLKIIKRLQEKYSEIKCYRHDTNLGGGPARNTAVENSLNDLIFCLDSDNVLAPNSIENLRKTIISQSVDCAAFEEIRYFKKDIYAIDHIWKFEKSEYYLSDYLSCFIVPGASGNYLYTKSGYNAVGGYATDASALDAWSLGFKISANNFRTIIVPGTHYYHRLSSSSYWVRSFKGKQKVSHAALRIISPYWRRIALIDWIRINTINRNFWFETIEKHPIRIK